jgi:hypothetical protein
MIKTKINRYLNKNTPQRKPTSKTTAFSPKANKVVRPIIPNYQQSKIIAKLKNLKPNLTKITSEELLTELKQRIEQGIIRLEPADNNYERGFVALNSLNYDYILNLSETVKELEHQGK